MTTHDVPDGLRVQGFRTRRSFGFAAMSQQATIAAALVLIADGTLGARFPGSLLVTVPLTLALAGLTAARRHGMPALAYYWAVFAWRRADRAGATSYRRVLLPQPYALDLPGVGASSVLVAAHDPTTDRPVGVVHDRSTGAMTVTTLLAPGGTLMAPTSAVRAGVRTWSSVLDEMSIDEQILGAQVTIQITPGAGEALADDVRARRRPDAPRLALDTIDELVRTTPRATASVTQWMSVSVDPTATANPPVDLAEQVAEALRVVDTLDMSGTGADIVRRATPDDLRRLVRCAFDPGVHDAREEQFAELSWGECGPVAADDLQEEYVHDGSVSVSWVLREMPRRPIPYSVLLPLLSPGRFQRRVTLSYRVLDPREGEAVLEREISNAEQRAAATAQVRGRATWSQKADRQRAERAAHQAASGAQVVDWTLRVTTTARRAADLPGARQELERAVKATKGIRMRPAFGAQAATFMAGLPIGYQPLVK
ncbi:SCO6880 family protein [Kitasatospora brasiliensis]|uniref:SCO6880 family protein n=1 Tax=Kitasatospora brasiliensis TaxID=3058040 RepID=UPI00292FD66E|nr:SCO6880 family protein [Kitasatospora sp. K002]